VREIADLYRGPLNDFVPRRDACAKQLRAAGDRMGADRIKALRKPSRIAWALNAAAATEHYAKLVESVNATISAQSRGGDARSAMNGLREAVRAFAIHAAYIAAEQGQKLDRSAVVSAVFAVLGDNAAFDSLHRGELADVPEAGGLDVLATITPPPLTVSSNPDRLATEAAAGTPGTAQRTRREEAALARAEAQLAELRAQTDEALRALNHAQSELDAAERRLAEATSAVSAAQARQRAAAAGAQTARDGMQKMEEKVAQLRSGLDS
jgi:hypothetical protein